ncbi:MAG: two-component regulator propeller domain-containing protein [Pseudomonadota bacterium]
MDLSLPTAPARPARAAVRRAGAMAALALSLTALALTAAAAGVPRWSQLASPGFSHLVAERGPPNLSTSLAEDGDGFLWIGSFGGLARWDGYRLRTYVPQPDTPGALPDATVQALHTDRLGRLWIGTNAHGVARYEREQDRFVTLGAGPAGLSHVSVLALAADAAGGMWVGTDAGVDHVDAAGTGVQRLRYSSANGMPEAHARALVLARDGALWVGTGAGLVRFDAAGHPSRVALGLEAPEVDSLCQASDGRIWIGTRAHGAFVAAEQGGAARAVLESGATGARLAGESVYSVAEARAGQIWLGTYGQGIVAVDAASGQTQRLRHDPSLPTSLVNDSVWAILRDRSGLVWAGTARGLSRHDPNQLAVLSVLSASGRPDGLAEGDVFSVMAAPDGRIWLGLANEGIDIVDPAAARVAALRPNPATPKTALPRDRVLALAAGAGSTVYAGTVRGAYAIDAGAARRIEMPGTEAAPRINALAFDGARLWIGSRDHGLTALAPGASASAVAALGDPRVTAMLHLDDGSLWVGSRNGLFHIGPNGVASEALLADARDPASLSSSYITALMADAQGRLWVGTLGGGVNVLLARDAGGRARFRRIGPEQGLPSPNIAALLPDRRGMVWASSDDGLALIDPQRFSARTVGRADGVVISNSWTGAAAVTKEGELLFGGLGGLTVVRPDLLRPWTYRPPVVVTDVRVGGLAVPAGRFNGGGSGANGGAAPLVVAADANSVTVEFSALDYSAPEHNHYAYRLEGYDGDWIATDPSRRAAAYTNLPPGDYRLLLRGSNRAGEWSARELAVPIRVLPAWYQTLWVRALALLALGALLYAMLRRHTANLERRQRELEHEVAQRTAQLRAQQAALVESNRGLNEANADLATSAATLRQLGEVGREITANMGAQAVFAALHGHLDVLLKAPRLAIYRINGAGTVLELAFGRDQGAPLAPPLASNAVRLDEADSHVARAARERHNVVVELETAQPGVRADGAAPPLATQSATLSAEVAPLIADGRLLGVMAIESPIAHAFGERERLIFRTVCAYGAIALANAEARAKLVQQEKLASLGGLVAGMAHEMNTPLGTIVSAISGADEALQNLADATASGRVNRSVLDGAVTAARDFTEIAMRNARRAVGMIDTFKSIVTRRAGEGLVVVELESYLPQVATLARRALERAGHAISIAVEPGLRVETDPEALTEVMTHVLDNVVDHAFDGGGAGTLTISARRGEAGKTEIVVADSGHGIAAADLAHVFDPFFTTRSGSGGHVGLGLNVAFNHVTERLNGSIVIDSTPGAGTTVTIRF